MVKLCVHSIIFGCCTEGIVRKKKAAFENWEPAIKVYKENFNHTDLEQMIGNAVPIKLAEYVGRSILNYKNDFLNKTVKRKSFQMNLHFDFSESALSL